MLLVLTWGCRASEASYIVHANSFEDGARFSAHFDAKFAATCPAWYTKTSFDYKYPVWEETEWAVHLLEDLHDRVPTLQKLLGDPKTKFKTAIENFYKDHVMPEAAEEYDEVTVRADAGKG